MRTRVPLDPGEPCPELTLNADGFTVVLPDPVPILLRALRAAQARPNHAQTAAAGISAAEMVAARRTGQPLPPGLEDLHKAVSAMPPPDAALLSFARSAVRAVALGCACEQATFLTEPARQAWRDGLANLHARLGG